MLSSLSFYDKTLCFLATGFGTGYLRPAPGSWGSLLGLILAFPVAFYTHPLFVLLPALLFFLCGIIAAERYNLITNSHDSSSIVIDEIAGQMLVLSFLPVDFLIWFFAFILFRFFDILKPFPLSWLDKNIDGGLGVMVDDIGAAFYSISVLLVFLFFFIL